MSASAGCLAADAAGSRGAAPTAAAVPKALHESTTHTYAELLHRFDTPVSYTHLTLPTILLV